MPTRATGAQRPADVKTQTVRAFDVLVLGPGTIAAAMAARKGPLPPWAVVSLVVYGGATILYNARNWWLARGKGVEV